MKVYNEALIKALYAEELIDANKGMAKVKSKRFRSGLRRVRIELWVPETVAASYFETQKNLNDRIQRAVDEDNSATEREAALNTPERGS